MRLGKYGRQRARTQELGPPERRQDHRDERLRLVPGEPVAVVRARLREQPATLVVAPGEDAERGVELVVESLTRLTHLLLELLDPVMERLEAAVERVREPAPDHAGEKSLAGTP